MSICSVVYTVVFCEAAIHWRIPNTEEHSRTAMEQLRVVSQSTSLIDFAAISKLANSKGRHTCVEVLSKVVMFNLTCRNDMRCNH